MDQRREDLAQWAVAMIRQHADFDVTAKMDMVSGDASFSPLFPSALFQSQLDCR